MRGYSSLWLHRPVDWRAGCGKSARPVRREERPESTGLSYPYRGGVAMLFRREWSGEFCGPYRIAYPLMSPVACVREQVRGETRKKMRFGITKGETSLFPLPAGFSFMTFPSWGGGVRRRNASGCPLSSALCVCAITAMRKHASAQLRKCAGARVECVALT